jgi:hypothetical protein
MITQPINHPLSVGQLVRANRPSCPCKAAKLIPVFGRIGKVISNNSGHWYYLSDAGVTVKGEWITEVVPG